LGVHLRNSASGKECCCTGCVSPPRGCATCGVWPAQLQVLWLALLFRRNAPRLVIMTSSEPQPRPRAMYSMHARLLEVELGWLKLLQSNVVYQRQLLTTPSLLPPAAVIDLQTTGELEFGRASWRDGAGAAEGTRCLRKTSSPLTSPRGWPLPGQSRLRAVLLVSASNALTRRVLYCFLRLVAAPEVAGPRMSHCLSCVLSHSLCRLLDAANFLVLLRRLRSPDLHREASELQWLRSGC
jgi:hypothetical protein